MMSLRFIFVYLLSGFNNFVESLYYCFLLANIAKAECSLNVGLSPTIGLSGNMSFDMFYAMANLIVKNNAIKVIGA
ncbi:unnamed protein product [Trifolium pratense]|uniref:Uncharacterized protein n=1 Tax=Trifolium pratense TaxID=57577 RepID=A0ACB0JT02_TRIPR|nr:unnamed protein product [Trifolium pratense]